MLIWGAVSVASLVALLSIVDTRGFRRYWRLRQDVAALSERNRQLEAKNRSMLSEIEALRTDIHALERAAREELGFVRADEVVIHLE